MIRYWHWLVSQKKTEPELEYYLVDGTAAVEDWFNPEYEGQSEDSEDDYFDIIVQQNENN